MSVAKPPVGGACSGKPVKWFYPEPRLAILPLTARQALQLCKACGIKSECLNYALKWEAHGIWGGMTEPERNHERRLLNIIVERPGGKLAKNWMD